jgi:hypothetical protein
MKETHYKNLSISFALIIIWILTLIFSTYEQKTGLFETWSLYFNFAISIMGTIILSILLIILRLIFYKKINFRNSTLYTLFGYLNFTISIIWFITLLMKILTIDYNLTESAFTSCFLSIIILSDIYWPRKSNKNVV